MANHTQTWAILLAAGQGKRLKQNPDDPSKQFLDYNGLPLFWHSALTFAAVPGIRGVVFVFSAREMEYASALVHQLHKSNALGLPFKIVEGGAERQDSVWCGLQALPPECDKVLVHDAARPFASAALSRRLIDELEAGRLGVIPGLEPNDTIKQIDGQGIVQSTPPRSSLRYVQTPQGFDRQTLQQAHMESRAKGLQVTDDAAMLEACGFSVLVVPGEAYNHKITRPEDIDMLQGKQSDKQLVPCTGLGYDVHKYGGNRPFKLGGVLIESTDITVSAHSDGDVLLHALMDALLGCIAAGDIGLHFPDNDKRYDNISSAVLLAEVLELVRSKEVTLTHVDMTVIAQAPKVLPYRSEIAKNIAKLLHLNENQVNLKATTEEGLGFTGAKQGIKALVSVIGLRPL